MPDQKQRIASIGDDIANLGKPVITNGYSIIPIKPGTKFAALKGWQDVQSNTALLNTWIKENNFGRHGIGILAKHTPAIDIDVSDEDVAQRIEDYIVETIPGADQALIRYGRRPRRLLMFRTDKPFTKVATPEYIDEWGDVHKVELLGDGQYFCAYGIHPTTKVPFAWTDNIGPAEVPHDELPLITREQAQEIVTWVNNEIAPSEFWKVKKGSKPRDTPDRVGQIDYDNPDRNQTDISRDKSPSDFERMVTEMVDAGTIDIDDYDEWFQLGMGLYHQSEGDDWGFELWVEVSKKGEKYDASECRYKWKTFDVGNKNKVAYTGHSIIAAYNKFKVEQGEKLAKGIRERFVRATTTDEWQDIVKDLCHAKIYEMNRLPLIEEGRTAYKRVTGATLPAAKAAKMMAYSPEHGEPMPAWLEDWVYHLPDDKFVSVEHKFAVTQQAFNTSFMADAVSEADEINGKKSASRTPVELATEIYRVPEITGMIYMPIEKKKAIIQYNGQTMLNLYSDRTIPELPDVDDIDELPRRDQDNIEFVRNHFLHLLPDEREARLLFDWMAYVVRNPGKHPNYAVVLQGTQGDGKTFLARLMATAMGIENVNMINPDLFEGSFTDWCAGQCLNVVEEIRLLGESRYKIINNLKQYITNDFVNWHGKYRKAQTVPNTTAYMLLTNHRDAVPIDDNDRRYMILFSQWQSREQLTEFKKKNPDYYERLYATLHESPGALRLMFLNHKGKYSDEFNPTGDAPDTRARQEMIFNTTPEYVRELRELIDDNNQPLIGREMFDFGALIEILNEKGDIEIPHNAWKLNGDLEREGFERLGRTQIAGFGGGKKRMSLWIRQTARELFTFSSGGRARADTDKIRKYFEQRLHSVGQTDSRISQSAAVRHLLEDDEL